MERDDDDQAGADVCVCTFTLKLQKPSGTGARGQQDNFEGRPCLALSLSLFHSRCERPQCNVKFVDILLLQQHLYKSFSKISVDVKKLKEINWKKQFVVIEESVRSQREDFFSTLKFCLLSVNNSLSLST